MTYPEDPLEPDQQPSWFNSAFPFVLAVIITLAMFAYVRPHNVSQPTAAAPPAQSENPAPSPVATPAPPTPTPQPTPEPQPSQGPIQ